MSRLKAISFSGLYVAALYHLLKPIMFGKLDMGYSSELLFYTLVSIR
jgi:hypothetical protein